MTHHAGIVQESLSKLLEVSERDDDYLKLTTPTGLNPCPVCGSPAEMWQRKHEDQFHKVIVCPNNGKKDSDYQCPCYFPPECYYHATRREAVAYWQKHSSQYSISNTHLSFAALRSANVERMKEYKNYNGDMPAHGPDGSGWSPAQWFQAMTGEFGEYANVRKKYERGDLLEEDFLERAGQELADVQVYLDILANQIGIDLGTAVVKKFNHDSEKRGCRTELHVTPEVPVEEKSNEVHASHVLRYSASNQYDLVCAKCNGTDAREDRRLFYPCKG